MRLGASQLLCLTFSPSANLMPGGASCELHLLGRAPQRNLMTWFCPPIVLAEPCRMLRGRHAAGELAVDVDVVGVDEVADANLGGDRLRRLR